MRWCSLGSLYLPIVKVEAGWSFFLMGWISKLQVKWIHCSDKTQNNPHQCAFACRYGCSCVWCFLYSPCVLVLFVCFFIFKIFLSHASCPSSSLCSSSTRCLPHLDVFQLYLVKPFFLLSLSSCKSVCSNIWLEVCCLTPWLCSSWYLCELLVNLTLFI